MTNQFFFYAYDIFMEVLEMNLRINGQLLFNPRTCGHPGYKWYCPEDS